MCLCLFQRKEETGGNTNTSGCGPHILGVADEKKKTRKENLFNSRRYSSSSLFIFQDLKEWRRGQRKSRTIYTLKVAFLFLSIRRKSLT